jgi:hypothetical protein
MVRPARVDDIPGIQGVARKAWAAAYAGIIPGAIQRELLDRWYSTAALEDTLDREHTMFLVAEREQGIVGSCQFRPALGGGHGAHANLRPSGVATLGHRHAPAGGGSRTRA